MPVRVANGGEVANNSTNVSWRIYEDVLSTCTLGNLINLFPRLALKPKMIQTRFHFVLHHHQYERRIYAFCDRWAEPDIMSPFRAAIAHDRESTD